MANPTPVSTKHRNSDGGVTLGGVVGSSGVRTSDRNRSTHGALGHLVGVKDAPSPNVFAPAQLAVEHAHRQRVGFQGSLSQAMVKVNRPLRRRADVLDKVLRNGGAGFFQPVRQLRINGEFPYGSSSAVKGDAVIHGPRLVAQPVGSEWRIHRLHQTGSQSN